MALKTNSKCAFITHKRRFLHDAIASPYEPQSYGCVRYALLASPVFCLASIAWITFFNNLSNPSTLNPCVSPASPGTWGSFDAGQFVSIATHNTDERRYFLRAEPNVQYNIKPVKNMPPAIFPAKTGKPFHNHQSAKVILLLNNMAAGITNIFTIACS